MFNFKLSEESIAFMKEVIALKENRKGWNYILSHPYLRDNDEKKPKFVMPYH